MSKPPLVSLAIFTYNQEDFIEEAVQSAFAQDYENLEIIISDDNSPDQTFAIAQRLVAEYEGPHEVRLTRNETNLRIANHHNKVIDMAEGELVVLIAGDDISYPQRVREVAAAWLANNKPIMLVSKFDCIDAHSQPLPLEPHIHFRFPEERLTPTPKNLWNFLSLKSGLKVYGSTESVSKAAWEYFGPIHKDLRAEDIVYFFRALMLGKFHFIDASHVAYRMAHKIETVLPPKDEDVFGRPVNAEYAKKVHLFKLLAPALEQCKKDLALHMQKNAQAKADFSGVYQNLTELIKVRNIWINWYNKKWAFKLKGLFYIASTRNKFYLHWTYKHILKG